MDLGGVIRIDGVVTQPRKSGHHGAQRVTKFQVMTSVDDITYVDRGSYVGNVNSNANEQVSTYLDVVDVPARYVKIVVEAYDGGHMSMRAAVLGAQRQEYNISTSWHPNSRVLKTPVFCSAPAEIEPTCASHEDGEFEKASQTAETRAVWEKTMSNGAVFGGSIGNKTAFDAAFSKSTTQIVARWCMSCQASHKYIFYKRLTAIPDGFSLYNTLYHTWASKDNQLNVDFALYSTYEDALRDLSRWTFCNYDDNGVGFPRDCGPTGYVGGQWNNPGRHNYGFYVDVGIAAANSGDDGDRVFISNGGGTMCAQEEGGSVQTHAAPFDEDGKIQYHLTADVCRQFESGASYYDTNIYDSWTRASAATQNRQRRSTAANFLVMKVPTRIGDCTEWVCKDGSESCAGDEQVCFRAENNAGWSTWIKGENIARDTSCQTWVCHSGAGKCDGANGILPQYRCLESTEGLVCKDYHPILALDESTNSFGPHAACEAACNEVGCSTFYSDPAFAVPCTVYDHTWPVATSVVLASLALGTDGNAHGSLAPLTGACFHPAPAQEAQVESESDADNGSCFVDDERPHSETTCRPVVPLVDEFGGVNWKKK
eukprot:gene27223-24956_t